MGWSGIWIGVIFLLAFFPESQDNGAGDSGAEKRQTDSGKCQPIHACLRDLTRLQSAGSRGDWQRAAPHEVWLISGIIASNTAGVDRSLSVPVNGAVPAFDKLDAVQRRCPGADNDVGEPLILG